MNYHTIMVYEVELQLHAFPISVLNGGEQFASGTGHFKPIETVPSAH